MKVFHEPYMPSREIMLYTLDKLQFLGMEMIAPQHGSVIKKDKIEMSLAALKNFDYGQYLV